MDASKHVRYRDSTYDSRDTTSAIRPPRHDLRHTTYAIRPTPHAMRFPTAP